MPVEVILPKVDMDMSHGTLAVWHVASGDSVEKGSPLFDIETDKAAMEVESPASGRLHAVTAQPGDKIAVGTVIALIYAEGEAIPDAAPTAPNPDANAPAPDAPAPVEVILPKVDMDMSHGTLAVWHAAEGQVVVKGAPLFDIETDKAAMEVEAPASGTLAHVTAKPGEKLPVGTVLAYIYLPGSAVGSAAPTAKPAAITSAAPQGMSAQPAPADPGRDAVSPPPAQDAYAGPTAALRATPAARAAARKSGVALTDIRGTGPRGRIQNNDVATHLASRLAHPADAHSANQSPQTRLDAPPPFGWSRQPGPLHVSARKGKGTPIVLLHGFTADSQSWAPLEKALGPDHPLIRIELPGHGRSPRRAVDNFAHLSRMVVEAFDDATRTHDRVHLLGHSLGGALAIAIADIRPRRVASLALIAPTGFGPEIDAAALTGIIRATQSESLAPWLRRLTATPEGVSDDYARAAMKLRADPELRAAQADMAQVLFPDGVQPFDLRPAFARLDCPTTVIWGKSDHILPNRHAIGATGDFALHLLVGAGHVPQIECPDRVARILLRHLAAATVI